VWGLIVAAGVVHAMQAAAYEVQRQEYNFWGLKRKSAELPMPEDLVARAQHSSFTRRFLNGLYRVYVWMQYRVSGTTILFRQNLAITLATHASDESSIRARYREIFGPTVRHWAVLSSNYRTIAIFVCAIFRAPLAYFAFELIGFSLIMFGLSFAQRKRYVAMSDYLRAYPV
jgi:hypothetical protein